MSSTTHFLVPAGFKFDTPESFNAELGGTDDPKSNIARYGQSYSVSFLVYYCVTEIEFLLYGLLFDRPVQASEYPFHQGTPKAI